VNADQDIDGARSDTSAPEQPRRIPSYSTVTCSGSYVAIGVCPKRSG
jgi:hypothetical protein